MRYKLMAFAAVLLIGTPAFGQEMSPIIIKTGEPTPSVVRTGELFKVIYQAQFYDEVLVIEERMQPENIVAEPFEVVKLEVVSLPDHGDENTGIIHTKDFTYTFRIIKPEKGDKKIPSFNFIWIIKKAGTTETNAKEGNEFKEMPTEEVGVRYVYSPVKPPPLNIRDEINLSLFSWTGVELRRYGYGAIAGSSLLALIVVLVWVRSGKTKKEKSGDSDSGEMVTDVVIEAVPDVLPKKARKNFLWELNKLLGDKNIDVPSPELEKKVYLLLRELILSELSGNPVKALVSDTPSELYVRLKALGPKHKKVLGSKYEVFVVLSEKLKKYYEDMESGQLVHFKEPRLEIQELVNAVVEKSFPRRFRDFLADLLRMPHD